MNVSMQDAFNLGWKLAAVLRGQCPPELLHSYSAERQAIAKELIDFDREWAKMLSAPLKTSETGEGVDPKEVEAYFVRHGRYTAGTATRYAPSALTGEPIHAGLATGFPIGARFQSAPVIRLGDAKPVELGHVAQADGRWRLYAFADKADPSLASSRLRALCAALADSPASPLRRYAKPGADIDAVIDLRAILQQAHRDVAVENLPSLLLPRKGRLGLIDYEKVFCPDRREGQDIFDLRGIDRERGCLVIVRPDQYVANVLPLDDHPGLTAFFAGFMTPQSSG
jgi:phenol 2-monooxygenase